MKKFLKDLPFYVFCFLFAIAIEMWMGFRQVKYKLGFQLDFHPETKRVEKTVACDTARTA